MDRSSSWRIIVSCSFWWTVSNVNSILRELTMEQLIKNLGNTTKLNEKMGMLREVSDNTSIKRAFYLCYHPHLNTFMKKIDVPSKRGHLSFLLGFGKFEQLFNQLVNREITGNNAKQAVNDFLSECTPDAQELFVKILKKDFKVGVNVGTLNKIWGDDFLPKLYVQLAKEYKPNKSYGVDYWWASPKLDGIRSAMQFKDDKLTSRSGKRLVGFDSIEQSLVEVKQIIKNRYNISDLLIDGELYNHDEKFQDIISHVTVKKVVDKSKKEMIGLTIFAVCTDPLVNTDTMVNILNDIKIVLSQHHKINVVDYVKVDNNPDEIKKLCEDFVSQGYEGVMLRHPLHSYTFDRSDNLLKYKLFIESDFTVVGFKRGKLDSKYRDTLGTISCEGISKDGKAVKFEVGSGLSDNMRSQIWANKDFYLGKRLEVKYQGVTDAIGEDGKYSLRFPVFNKFKLD